MRKSDAVRRYRGKQVSAFSLPASQGCVNPATEIYNPLPQHRVPLAAVLIASQGGLRRRRSGEVLAGMQGEDPLAEPALQAAFLARGACSLAFQSCFEDARS